MAALTEKVFRYKVMPAAEQRWEGKLVQYIGTTDATYTKGYFYICKEGETAGTYIWEQTDVQPNNDYVLWDGTHAQYEVEQSGIPDNAFLNFTDDYDDLVQVGVYSTEETKTGELILNKPVYQKTYLMTNTSSAAISLQVPHGITNLDKVIGWTGTSMAKTGATNVKCQRMLPFSYYGTLDWAVGVTVNDNTSNRTLLVQMGVNASNEIGTLYITLKYTKTTD